MNDLADLLAPPSEAAAARALRNYAGRVSDTYGKRLASIHLFGSRARGDHRPDSDADLAVILTEFEGSALNEKMRLVDLGFDALTDDGLMIQPWPFTLAQWELRAPGGRFADLLATAKRDGVRLDTASRLNRHIVLVDRVEDELGRRDRPRNARRSPAAPCTFGQRFMTPNIRPSGSLSIAIKLVMLAMVMPRLIRFKLRRKA